MFYSYLWSETDTHFESALDAVLHDRDELLLAQVPVAIFVEQLEDHVRHVTTKCLANDRLRGAHKVLCFERKETNGISGIKMVVYRMQFGK